jgi:hypothetical protein
MLESYFFIYGAFYYFLVGLIGVDGVVTDGFLVSFFASFFIILAKNTL